MNDSDSETVPPAKEPVKQSAPNTKQVFKAEDLPRRSIADDLYDGIGMKGSDLQLTDSYSLFATKVGEILLQGEAPRYIPNFFSELLQGSGQKLDSEKLNDILMHVKKLYNEKKKQEKKDNKSVKLQPK